MSDVAVLALKPGQLDAVDRRALRNAGIVVIEVDNPEAVRFMRPAAEISSTEMLAIALRAIKNSGSFAAQYLGEELVKAVLAKPIGDTK